MELISLLPSAKDPAMGSRLFFFFSRENLRVY
nr:MAG TPA: hypothetical protein [Caudoviricetes sp.]